MAIAASQPGPRAIAESRSRTTIALLWLSVLTPLLAPVAAVLFTWQRWVTGLDLALLGGMYCVCGLGITVGYHRMLTHRSFQPHPVVKFIFLALGSISAMGPALLWAGTHIKHHISPDDDGDPHSPWDWVDRVRSVRKTGIRQLTRAHFLWMIYGEHIDAERHAKWLLDDRMVMLMSRWPVTIGWITIGMLFPLLVGGWQGLVWGGIIRIGLTHHITWSINSICHVYGRRMFDTPDRSMNNWLCGVLGFGEGWHNNHHAFPRSAFHGLRWWQIDVSGYIIRAMEVMGCVRNVWRVPKDRLQTRLVTSRKAG